jgi:putative zinc-dependent peptidase DUF5700
VLRSLLSISFAVFALAAAGVCAARPLAPDDVVIDLSPAIQVRALWPGAASGPELPRAATAVARQEALRLAGSPAYRTLRAFQSEQTRCFLPDDDLVRALLFPDSVACGITLIPAFRERAALDSLLEEISQREAGIRSLVAADAGRYLPGRASWKPVRVYVVLSSRWSFDAVTLSEGGSGEPVVLINATEVLAYPGTARERVETLEHVMAHEVFHACVRQIEPGLVGWSGFGPRATSTYGYLARVIVDEGVAHYIDWRSRAGSDTLFTRKPGAREKRAFSQLQLAVKRLHTNDAGARSEILQLAANGPLWSKYGAISGMFAAWRIESRLGADSLRAAVVGGPPKFLTMYGTVAAADTSLGRVPKEIVEGWNR